MIEASLPAAPEMDSPPPSSPLGSPGQERPDLLPLLLASMRHGIALFDAAGRLVAANELARRLGALPGDTLPIGASIEALIEAQAAAGEFGDEAQTAAQLAAARSFDRSRPGRYTRTRPDGRVLEITSDPTPDGGFIATYSDITARSRAEEAARDRAAMLSAALDSMQHGCLIFGPDDRLLALNALATSCAGLAPGDLSPGHSLAELAQRQFERGALGEGEAAELRRQRLLQGEHGHAAQDTLILPDGRVVKVISNPIPSGGRVITFTDITALVAAEKAAEARAATLQAMLENMRHGVTLFDAGHRVVATNRLMPQLAGVPAAEVMPGRHLRDLIAAQVAAAASGDPELDRRHAAEALTADRSRPLRHTRPSRDGRVLDVTSDPMPDGGFVLTITDITALARAEAEARQQAQVQEAMLRAIRHGIALYDADGRLVAVNRISGSAGGPTFPEGDRPLPAGTHFIDVLRRQAAIGGLGPEPEREFARLVALDRRQSHRYMRRTSTGRLIEVHSDPMPDGGFAMTFSDVTALAEAEAEAESRAAMFRAALDNMRHGFMLFGPDRRLRATNRLASEIGGLSAEELAPGILIDEQIRLHHARGMYGPPPKSDETLARLLQADRSKPWRRTRHMPDGRVVEVFSDPTPDGGFVITFTDITARSAAEAEAQDRARNLQVTLDSIRHGIALYGPDRRLLLANQLAGPGHGLFNLPARTGVLFDDLLHEQHALGMFGSEPEASRVLAQSLTLDRSRPSRLQRRAPNGQVFDIASNPTPDGGFVVTHSDVSELEAAKAEASERAAMLQLMFDNMQHGITYFGPNERLRAFNRLAEDTMGGPTVRLRLGMTLDELGQLQAAAGILGDADTAAAILERRRRIDRSRQHRYLRRGTGGRFIEIISNPAPDGGFVVTHSDVTELLKAQAAAAERASQLQVMLDSMRHGIALFDRDRCLLAANALAAQINGLPVDALQPGRRIEDIAAEVVAVGLIDAAEVEKLLREDLHSPSRITRHRPDGSVIEIVRDPTPDGGFVITYSDVTALTRAETAARERAGVLQVMLENTRHGICYYGPDRRVIAANSLASDFGGYSPGTLRPGRTLEELVDDQLTHGVAGDQGAETARMALAMDRSQPARYMRTAEDGRIIEVTSDPTPDGGFVVTTSDVTPAARAEQEARSRAAILQAMLDNSRQGITLFDMQGRVLAANGMAASMNGLPPDALSPGQPIQALIRAQAELGYFDAVTLEDALSLVPEDRPWPVPYSRQRTLGGGRIVEITTDSVGGVGYIRSYRDISEELRARAELERARDAAEAANRAKSRFLATMSHELRTPLNAVIGFSEAYMIDNDPARRLDYVQSIHEAGRHLLSLIDDILDVTRSETTGFAITESRVDVVSLAEGAVHMMQATAATAGVSLRASLPPSLPPLRADELRLRQVLLNLVANAVKFTPSGGAVTLDAGIEPEGDLLLRITDTGIGMEAADIPRAFEPFTQLDSSLSRRFPGSGLGLYLARALAEAQGATLTLDSTPGAGTIAVLRFPKARLLADMAA
ncbi:PAS-domain containing protein [Belnapia rosea]|uniref:histidine kinase n=1 Tax=Belnapia rosea TaxID=938405 RepID=A0A1G6QYH9_9PROT|nr:PAS-domain containing protein [Belnapia rosea]SDC97034.1 Signal transduction histidine kinase [Belnapia rosea]